MSSVAALDVRLLSRTLKALGDETRLRIVALLAHGELCACHLESALRLSQPNTSRQLSVLKSAGLVEPRRQGSWIFYSKAQLRVLVSSFSKREILRQDVERLLKAKGPKACR